eukprot:c3276_g2_i1 orf=132-329(-)
MSVSFAQGKDSCTQMAYSVLVQAGEWKARLDFIIVPMDSFEAILGVTWIDKYMMALYEKGLIWSS